MIISLIYISTSSNRPNKEDLVNLLKECHKNNGSKGITGLLLYNGAGMYLQVLEGESESVEQLYEKIKLDKRHRRIVRLSKEIISERSFPDWKMGFRQLDTLPAKEIEGFSPFMERDANLVTGFLKNNNEFALKLVNHFRDVADELIF